MIVLDRRPHRKYFSKSAAACELDQIDAFDINVFKTEMREGEDVDWQIKPLIPSETCNWNSGVQWVYHDAFAAASGMEDKAAFGFFWISDGDFDVNGLVVRYVNLKQQEWLEEA